MTFSQQMTGAQQSQLGSSPQQTIKTFQAGASPPEQAQQQMSKGAQAPGMAGAFGQQKPLNQPAPAVNQQQNEAPPNPYQQGIQSGKAGSPFSAQPAQNPFGGGNAPNPYNSGAQSPMNQGSQSSPASGNQGVVNYQGGMPVLKPASEYPGPATVPQQQPQQMPTLPNGQPLPDFRNSDGYNPFAEGESMDPNQPWNQPQFPQGGPVMQPPSIGQGDQQYMNPQQPQQPVLGGGGQLPPGTIMEPQPGGGGIWAPQPQPPGPNIPPGTPRPPGYPDQLPWPPEGPMPNPDPRPPEMPRPPGWPDDLPWPPGSPQPEPTPDPGPGDIDFDIDPNIDTGPVWGNEEAAAQIQNMWQASQGGGDPIASSSARGVSPEARALLGQQFQTNQLGGLATAQTNFQRAMAEGNAQHWMDSEIARAGAANQWGNMLAQWQLGDWRNQLGASGNQYDMYKVIMDMMGGLGGMF